MSKITYLSLAVVAIGLVISLTVAFIGISTNQTLADENRELQETIDNIKNKQPTLVFHVSEKGPDYEYARLPNASNTYNQILEINNNYEVLLLPEYMNNLDATQELAWIEANFGGPQGIPIMLDTFGGGSQNKPTPQLTIDQITQACNTANVKCLRIGEVISWHIENKQPFPTNYLNDLLEYCQNNNLKIFWTEWKDDFPDKDIETFSAIKEYIRGYEDTVTVSFSTNSEELEPADGFLKLNQKFLQWGASIQPWYWHINHNQDLMTCPPSLILEHTLTAKALGAKIIQFEPYWYFFDNGTPNNNLKLLLNNIKDII